MRDPLHLWRLTLECHRDNVERTFVTAVWHSMPAVEETQCRAGYARLLRMSHVFLRGGLYAFLAGLYLYKMYSILCERDDVDLQVPASPVSGHYRVPETFQMGAGDVFSSFA